MESTRDLSERETQFHAALLCVGNVPNIRYALDFDGMMCTTKQRQATFAVMKAHKELLIVHLEQADYFDMYYNIGRKINNPGRLQLTAVAAQWIGEFYRWMEEQQRVA